VMNRPNRVPAELEFETYKLLNTDYSTTYYVYYM
jgi:hypothetical protein